MAETLLTSNTYSHYDPDENALTGDATGSGWDTTNFNVPSGRYFSRVELKALDSTMGSHAEVAGHSKIGSTGNCNVVTSWAYNLFGKIRYQVNVYSDNIPPRGSVQTITMNVFQDPLWWKKSLEYIDRKYNIILVATGLNSQTIGAAFGQNVSGTRKYTMQEAQNAAKSAVLCVLPPGTIEIGLTTLGAIAIICLLIAFIVMEAVNKGYALEIEANFKGMIWDWFIKIKLTAPSP